MSHVNDDNGDQYHDYQQHGNDDNGDEYDDYQQHGNDENVDEYDDDEYLSTQIKPSQWIASMDQLNQLHQDKLQQERELQGSLNPALQQVLDDFDENYDDTINDIGPDNYDYNPNVNNSRVRPSYVNDNDNIDGIEDDTIHDIEDPKKKKRKKTSFSYSRKDKVARSYQDCTHIFQGSNCYGITMVCTEARLSKIKAS